MARFAKQNTICDAAHAALVGFELMGLTLLALAVLALSLPATTDSAFEPGVIDAAIAALRSGGRLVINAVTLESEALLIARHAAFGGELIRIAISRAGAVGEKNGWRAAMPVTQWAWAKP
jgi:hypothetical protein